MTVNWTLVSTIAGLVGPAVSYVLMRWVAATLRSIQQDFAIALLKLQNELSSVYATKPELERAVADFNRQIDLAGRIDRIPNMTAKLLARSGRAAGDT